jgi:hypothetical protein
MRARRIAFALATALATMPTIARGDDVTPPPSPDREVDGVVQLHVDANAPDIHIRRRDPIRHVEEDLCAAPCDTVLDGRDGRPFQFTGDASSAEPFTLNGYRGNVTARVTVHPAMRYGGGALVGIGAGAVLTGALVMLLGVMTHGSRKVAVLGGAEPSGAEPFLIGGGVTGGAGVLALVGGITLLVQGKASYDLEPSRPGEVVARRKPVIARPRAAAAELPSPDRPGVVRLHIESNTKDVTVRRHDPIRHVDDELCKLPCDTVLDGRDGRPFYLEGGASRMKPFTLTGLQGDVTARVKAYPAMRYAGASLMSIGGAGMVVMTTMLLLSRGSLFRTQQPPRTALLVFGVSATLSTLTLTSGIATFALGKAEYELVP